MRLAQSFSYPHRHPIHDPNSYQSTRILNEFLLELKSRILPQQLSHLSRSAWQYLYRCRILSSLGKLQSQSKQLT